MSGNLHKSEEGWGRLRARVNAREGVRAAKMDHRVSAPKPVPVKVEEGAEPESADFIVRKGRKRVRAFVAQNGRSE